MRRVASVLPCLALSLIPAPAGAAPPQANAGLTVGGALTDLRTNGPRAAFHLGARGDLLFFRQRERDMGFGPYVDFATAAFDTVEFGAGASWLVPGWKFPFLFSAGVLERHAPNQGWEPGLATTVFVGPRSYNFHSRYDLAGGIFLQGRYGLGNAQQADLVLGAQIDLTFFAYPFLFLFEAIRR